ncbi:MAG: hypothetical protein ABL927_07760 [Bdellovibrionales bacterium]
MKAIPLVKEKTTLGVSLICAMAFASALISGCGKGSSFSLLSQSDTFTQSAGVTNSKADILWVIDNSGSMESSQSNVVNNLNSFIQDFSTKNLDFKMAVTSTDAYKEIFNGNTKCSQFRDGILNSSCNTVNGRTYSGERILSPLTLNLTSVFLINASLTDSANNLFGSGDERAFQSIKQALNSTLNAGFLRTDSFLSIIIVSDEDDFSHDNSSLNENYNSSLMHPIDTYVTYLDSVTGSTPTNRRYNVNAMAIFDTTCQTFLNTSFTGRKIGVRYGQLIDAVNTAFPNVESQGLKTSLCGNFADDLNNIAQNILSLSSRFNLNRIPIESTITIQINGVSVPNRDTNPLADGGWVYESATNSILFVGAYIPASGSSINIHYDPVAYGI